MTPTTQSSGSQSNRAVHILASSVSYCFVYPLSCLVGRHVGILFVLLAILLLLPLDDGVVVVHGFTLIASTRSASQRRYLSEWMTTNQASSCNRQATAHIIPGWISSRRQSPSSSSLSMIYAPPGSGYQGKEDEESEFPDSYIPMMEYPGTMRPGRTPENMPYHDLPLDDPFSDPMPWPHFQQIEWHHRWENPPHPHPIPMEEFIEQLGRWATPEMEAAMRAGQRRSVREGRGVEKQQEEVPGSVIMDDDEDDDDDEERSVELGEGVFGKLGSAAAVAAAAKAGSGTAMEESPSSSMDEDDGFDDLLLDLGLDAFDDEEEEEEVEDDDIDSIKADSATATKSKPQEKTDEPVTDNIDDDDEIDLDIDLGLFDDSVDDGDTSASAPKIGGVSVNVDRDDNDDDDDDDDVKTISNINVDDDDDLDLGLDDEDDLGDDGVSTLPLEDFGDGDSLDDEDVFGDGGFDVDAGDYDMDDAW